jgi:hypothetical protein
MIFGIVNRIGDCFQIQLSIQMGFDVIDGRFNVADVWHHPSSFTPSSLPEEGWNVFIILAAF